MRTRADYDPAAAAAEIVVRTRADQGLPPTITEPSVLDVVSDLIEQHQAANVA